jgi:hypothetical protein
MFVYLLAHITKHIHPHTTEKVKTTTDGVGFWAWKYKFGAFGNSWLV